MKCETVRRRHGKLSPNFGAKSSHIFTQSPQNVTVVCGIDCLACQDEFFVDNPPYVKGKYEHALDFALQLCRLFSVSESLDF
jgi:hypothetical protein